MESAPDGIVTLLDIYGKDGDATLNISEDVEIAQLKVNDYFEAISNNVTINQTAGNVTLDSGLNMGSSFASGTNTYNLTGGTLYLSTDSDTLGAGPNCVFNMDNASIVDPSGFLTVGNDGATTTATLNMNSSSINHGTSTFRVARNTSGILNMNNSSISCGIFYAPYSGDGETHITNSTISSSSSFHIASAGGSTGVMTMDGNCAVTSTGYFVVGRQGDSGTLIQRGGDIVVAGDSFYVGYNGGAVGNYTISGGSLKPTGLIRIRNDSTMTVNGSGATAIQAGTDFDLYMGSHTNTLHLNLDSGGTTLIEAGGAGWVDGIIEVDTLPSFDGQVNDTYDIVEAVSGIFGTTNLILVNESPKYTFGWQVVTNVGSQTLQLVLENVKSEFELWVAGFGLTGGDAAPDFDYDGDGLDNMYEFGVGGDPTNAADTGYPTSSEVVEDGGSNWLYYLYPERVGSELGYSLQLSDDLVLGNWTNIGYEVVGTATDIPTNGFNTVTNRVSTEVKDNQFIRLKIEQQ